MRVVLSLLFLASTSFAADPKPGEHVRVGAIAPVTLVAGQTVEVEIPLRVDDGYHIQSNPARLPQLIPTRLDVTAKPGIRAGAPVYPPGKMYRMAGFAEQISIYDGKVSIKLPLTRVGPLKFKQAQLAATLRYQPCNDKICFFPVTVPVLIPLVSGN